MGGDMQRAPVGCLGSRGRVRRRLLALTTSGAVLLGLTPGALAHRQPVDARIAGDTAARGMPMSDRLFGIFFEDINHAADGGLYPELVQNRSFEFSPVDNPSYTGLTAWSADDRGGAAGSVAIAGDAPLNAKNLNYLRVTIASPGTGDGAGMAVRNSGFNTGLHVEAGQRYEFSFWARRDGAADVPVRVRVEDAAGANVYATADATVDSADW